jgi:hypothetical protein
MTLIDLPEPNIPLLRKAVEWAEAEAAKTDGTCLWNQEDWAKQTDCGTAYCIAGYTVAIASPTVAIVPEPCDCGQDWCKTVNVNARRDGNPLDWEAEGQQLLGLDAEEAERLFDPGNSITDVRRHAEAIAARAGERL